MGLVREAGRRKGQVRAADGAEGARRFQRRYVGRRGGTGPTPVAVGMAGPVGRGQRGGAALTFAMVDPIMGAVQFKVLAPHRQCPVFMAHGRWVRAMATLACHGNRGIWVCFARMALGCFGVALAVLGLKWTSDLCVRPACSDWRASGSILCFAQRAWSFGQRFVVGGMT